MNAQVVSKTSKSVVIQIEVKFSDSMLQMEQHIQEVLNDAGNIATMEGLKGFLTTGGPIVLGNVKFTSKGQLPKEYQTPYGTVNIERHVYQAPDGGKTFCPLENNAHIIIKATPRFAKMASSKYSFFGGPNVCRDFESNHQRKVVLSTIQDLSNMVGSIALATEEKWSYATPKLDVSIETISLGLDGTSMLMCEDGWRMAMTGTISLYDELGKRHHTIYIGATPEYGKTTFYERFEREILHVKELYPAAMYVGLADGAKDNWSFLERHTERQTLDFYHVTEYLAEAAKGIFGKKEEVSRKIWLSNACHKLKHNKTGPGFLLKEMRDYLKEKKLTVERQQKVEKAVTYFKNNKHLMNYSENVELNLPIGSGVTEAACKVIIKERLCCSGMRWKEEGAAAVIALRCLSKSTGRWAQFWEKIDRYGVPEINVH